MQLAQVFAFNHLHSSSISSFDRTLTIDLINLVQTQLNSVVFFQGLVMLKLCISRSTLQYYTRVVLSSGPFTLIYIPISPCLTLTHSTQLFRQYVLDLLYIIHN